jgi:uncharacterized membrane protein
MKTVPPGTNGGVSMLGLAASLFGGAFVGLVFYIAGALFVDGTPAIPQHPIIYIGALSGFVGSLIDSFLGATFQATYYNAETKQVVDVPKEKDDKLIVGMDLLSNDFVNVLSIYITMHVAAYFGPYLFLSNC